MQQYSLLREFHHQHATAGSMAWHLQDAHACVAEHIVVAIDLQLERWPTLCRSMIAVLGGLK